MLQSHANLKGHGLCVKMFPNYPLHPHPCLHFAIQRKPGIFQRIINRESIQTPLGIRSSSYLGFGLIAINSEDVIVIVVNVDAVMHRVIFSMHQFNCYQSFRLNWRQNADGLILDLKSF